MTKFLTILDKIKVSFNKTEKCTVISDKEYIYIVDYQGQSYIVESVENNVYTILLKDAENIMIIFEENDSFKLTNVQNVAFVPIDGKDGLIGFGTSHCDCVLFDNYDFCFIEFKFNATSLAETAIRKNRGKAVSQLGNTINLFDEKFSRDYAGLNLEAYVCTPEIYPREEAGWENYRVSFLEEYGIELFERREKRCK